MAELNDAATLPEILAQLADIEVPPPVTYTPETAGWWVLLVTLISLVGAFAFVWLRRRRSNQYRRIAAAELRRLEQSAFSEDQPVPLTEVATLIKRTALAAFPRTEVAHLFGTRWRDWLTNTSRVESGPGLDALVQGAYRQPVDPATGRLAFAAARQWIESHHV